MPVNFCNLNSFYDNYVFSDLPNRWTPGHDYVTRMYVSAWEARVPDAALLLDLAQKISGMLAVTGDCERYRVKSVLLQQLAPNQKVSYANSHWWTTAWGSGCNDTFTSDDGTWTLDVVFTSMVDTAIHTDPEGWISYLQTALKGSRGIPYVYIGGLIHFEQGASAGKEVPEYEPSRTFWAGIQPMWEVTVVPSDLQDSGRKPAFTQINKVAPGVAWAKVPYIGQDGKGLAIGNAFEPLSLQPLATRGTILPSGPGVSTPGTTPSITDPTTWFQGPPDTSLGPISWRTLTTPQKLVAVGGGAVATWAIMKYVLRW